MEPTLRSQATLAGVAVVEGFGYWGGRDVRVELHPAEVDTGLVFIRTDLPGRPRIPARVEHRVEVPRRTALAGGGARVEMVEHVLAALYGMQVDNCEICVNAEEMPACDGSCLPIVEALLAAGSEKQPARQPLLVIGDNTRVGGDDSWLEAAPAARGLHIRYRLDYGLGHVIGRQSIELSLSPAVFHKELAAARTFITQEEAEWLQSQGLAKRATSQDLLVFDASGPVDNTLRFPNECVRHKALDLVGDLALIGCDFAGRVAAYRSGHRLNAEMARALLAEGRLLTDRRRTA